MKTSSNGGRLQLEVGKVEVWRGGGGAAVCWSIVTRSLLSRVGKRARLKGAGEGADASTVRRRRRTPKHGDPNVDPMRGTTGRSPAGGNTRRTGSGPETLQLRRRRPGFLQQPCVCHPHGGGEPFSPAAAAPYSGQERRTAAWCLLCWEPHARRLHSVGGGLCCDSAASFSTVLHEPRLLRNDPHRGRVCVIT